MESINIYKTVVVALPVSVRIPFFFFHFDFVLPMILRSCLFLFNCREIGSGCTVTLLSLGGSVRQSRSGSMLNLLLRIGKEDRYDLPIVEAVGSLPEETVR